MANPRLQIYVTDDLTAWLEQRAQRTPEQQSAARQATAELMLWRIALDAELRTMHWTLPEISLIAHIHGGGIQHLRIGAQLLWHDLADTFARHPGSYGTHHGVDETALLAKVRSLGPTAQHALTDAVARWWEIDPDDPATDQDRWAQVGIRIIPDPTNVVEADE